MYALRILALHGHSTLRILMMITSTLFTRLFIVLQFSIDGILLDALDMLKQEKFYANDVLPALFAI